jgi:glycosyltransferase involved in cell wall biosynthesis
LIYTVILTYNEEQHIARAIESANKYSDAIYIIDSFSTDNTIDICEKYQNVYVLKRKFDSHAEQFNWAIKQLPDDIWIFRLDADEIVNNTLSEHILNIDLNNNDKYGYYVNRYINFQGSKIKYGGLFPVEIVRFFKNGYGVCSKTIMDEHVSVKGDIGHLKGSLIDKNLNSIEWWVKKHLNYSSLEALKQLMKENSDKSSLGDRTIKREVYKSTYYKFPPFLRCAILFCYRYFIKGGFKNRLYGQVFIFLQSFWYRIMIDAKLEKFRKNNITDSNYIEKIDTLTDILNMPKEKVHKLIEFLELSE